MLNKTNILVIFILFTIGCVNLQETADGDVIETPTATIDVDATVTAWFQASNSNEEVVEIESAKDSKLQSRVSELQGTLEHLIANNTTPLPTAENKPMPPTPIVVERIVEVPVEVVKEVEVEKVVVVTPTPAPLKKARSIIFAGLDWTSVKVQNGVAMYIVENGYHYPTRLISGTSVPLFNSLADGYVDVSMEVWLPNQKVAWDNAIKRGQVVNVGKSLTDNWQSTFVVDKHTIDRNPGLRKATDLKQYYHLFADQYSDGKGVLVGCIAGWACRGVNDAQIEALGLADVIELRDPGSQAGLFASISAAGDRGTDWLGYMWGPTDPDINYELIQLEQDPPGNCGGEPKLGCAFDLAEVFIGANHSMLADAPDVVSFLNKYSWPPEFQLPAEAWYSGNKDKSVYKNDPGKAVAEWWMCRTNTWMNWVTYDAALSIQKTLQCY